MKISIMVHYHEVDVVLLVRGRNLELLTTGTSPGAEESPPVTEGTGLGGAGGVTTLWFASAQL